MSIQKYPHPNGTTYPIGTNGWELPGFFDIILPSSNYWEKNVTNVIVPTYGLWSGPGWSAGERSSDIDWTVAPCMNESVKTSSTPDNCYSLVDAICKTHDWNYFEAKRQYKIDGNELAYEAAIIRQRGSSLCMAHVGVERH